MTFNKKLIAGAVGTALTVGLGMQAAVADHVVLIPYVVKDTNRTTIVTLIGDGSSSGQSIHLQYWTKSTTDANTAACQPSSVELAFTENDIVTFDTAGLLGSGPLFGDSTNAAPLGTSISYTGSRHGYMITRDGSSGSWQSEAAYWLEVDLANGGAHGDHGISELGTDDLNNSLSDNVVLQDNDGRAVVFWPTSTAASAFTVTPIGENMDTSDNRSVVMQVRNDQGNQGAYDRNENGVDGTVPQTVRCVGRLTAAQLMPGVVANALWAATGGWGYMTNLGNNSGGTGELCAGSTGDCDAVVYQVDTSSAAGTGKFLQNAVRITSDQN